MCRIVGDAFHVVGWALTAAVMPAIPPPLILISEYVPLQWCIFGVRANLQDCDRRLLAGASLARIWCSIGWLYGASGHSGNGAERTLQSHDGFGGASIVVTEYRGCADGK